MRSCESASICCGVFGAALADTGTLPTCPRRSSPASTSITSAAVLVHARHENQSFERGDVIDDRTSSDRAGERTDEVRRARRQVLSRAQCELGESSGDHRGEEKIAADEQRAQLE